MKLNAPKGTKDILPDESKIWKYVEEKAGYVLEKANYKEIRTPIFESTELFTRGVGTSTDIVNKEMYTFVQKDRSLTLRPENTAGVVRAFIEHGMHRLPTPVKLWYKGPMFRYERPQAGRQRQFHQLGVEIFGIKESVADAEVIQLAVWYLEELGISDLSLEINNIGCPKCREDYKNKIKEAVREKLPEFCEDCKVRFDKNPLRMLDCKNEKCKNLLSSHAIEEIINTDYICEECSKHFLMLQRRLNILEIKYIINKKLVRGLDYYNGTVFEITSSGLGAQNAVCGGGRYDSLVEILGGPPTPAVGWAIGMERLINLVQVPESKELQVFVVSAYPLEASKLITELRKRGISTDFDMTGKNFSRQLEKALKLKSLFAVILGEEELNTKTLTIKNLSTGEQERLEKEEAIQKIIEKSKI
ncbi:MAG: histidine--tRNA ligase [bacterium]